MKKLLLLVSLFVMVSLANNLNAQPYASAIGLRLGYPVAASYKFFVSEPAAIELYAGFRYDGLNLGGMYQVHKSLSDVEGLYWYFGGGASISFYDYGGASDVSFGINGVIGLDYTFADAPINLSLDYMPTILFGGYYDGYGSYGALSARYILGQ